MNTNDTNTTASPRWEKFQMMLRQVTKRWVRIEAVYMIVLVAVVCSPQAYAGSTTLAGALDQLLTLLQACGAAMIGLACVKWGLDFLQGGGASREAFTSIGIGAGLVLGAKAIGSAL